MKKKLAKLCVFALLGFFSFSCSSNDIEKGLDCLFESSRLKVKHTIDANNPKTVSFTLEYTGDYTVEKIEWDFGDGSKETSINRSISHTYAEAGIYSVSVKPTVKNKNSTCTPEIKENVTVE